MYYPLQIPYILSKEFSSVVQYSEETVDALKDFTVCFWEMRPKTDEAKTVENVILTDGCVDLVADFAHKQIGFVGMSKTNFSFQINTPCRFYGVRMKPGAFYALTGITVAEVMDGFIPLQSYDSGFDAEAFFDLPVDRRT